MSISIITHSFIRRKPKVSSKTGRLYQLFRSSPSGDVGSSLLRVKAFLQADYSIYTDNFVTYKGHTFFSALKLSFLSVLPLTSHLSLLPSIDGRVLIGKDPAYPF